MEGLDLQAAGIALSVSPTRLRWIKCRWAGSSGGHSRAAARRAGGRHAGRPLGRKRILIASVALFGLFSLATRFPGISHRWCLPV